MSKKKEKSQNGSTKKTGLLKENKKAINEEVNHQEQHLDSLMGTHELTSPNIDKLIMYVIKMHNTIEVGLEMFLMEYIFKPTNLTWDELMKKGFILRIAHVVSEMDFSKKLKLVKHFGIIDQKQLSKLFKLNEIRIEFAHPAMYWQNILKYEQQGEYLRVLKIIHDAFKAITEVWSGAPKWLETTIEGLKKKKGKLTYF